MKCPICEKQLKKFIFNNPKELLFQCKDCNFNIKLSKKTVYFTLKDNVVFIDYKNLTNHNSNKLLKKVKHFINIYRVKLGKNKINYNIHFYKKCSKCKKTKKITSYYKYNNNTFCQCIKCRKNTTKKSYYKYNNYLRNKFTDIKKLQKRYFNSDLMFSFDDFKRWIKENGFKKFYKIFMNNLNNHSYSICITRKDRKKCYYLNNMEIVFYKDFIKKTNQATKIKNVAQIKDGKIIKIWESGSVAGREVKEFDQGGISKVCTGRYKSHAGFQWKYI